MDESSGFEGDPTPERFAQLERRVERLERIELAKATAARYARACDTRDADTLADVFTPDVVLRTARGEQHGIEHVTAAYASAFAATGRRRHFIVNHIAEVDARGEVHLDSYFHFVSQDGASVLGWGAYHDVVVVAGGAGRIREKTILLDVQTTLDAGWATADVAKDLTDRP
jgi:ketosteroid isomerase-like protein